MKVSIDVKNRDEAASIRRALALPDVRAFVLIVGALVPCTPRGRARILKYVADKADEDAARVTIETRDVAP